MSDVLSLAENKKLPFAVNEAFSQLRINLDFAAPDSKVIMINSGEPNEGKSFIAVSLLIKLAESGKRAVLVDADMRNSHLVNKYHMADDKKKLTGIEYYLSGKVPIETVVYPTDQENAFIIPATRSINYPMGLLENAHFTELLKTARENFDIVLIDTPPVLTVADALKIAEHCDGTLLVVKSRITSRMKAVRTLETLKRTGTPIVGVIMNAHSNSYNNRYGKHYGGYYGKKYGGYYGKRLEDGNK